MEWREKNMWKKAFDLFYSLFETIIEEPHVKGKYLKRVFLLKYVMLLMSKQYEIGITLDAGK